MTSSKKRVKVRSNCWVMTDENIFAANTIVQNRTDAAPRPTERAALEGLLRDIDASLARLGTRQLRGRMEAIELFRVA